MCKSKANAALYRLGCPKGLLDVQNFLGQVPVCAGRDDSKEVVQRQNLILLSLAAHQARQENPNQHAGDSGSLACSHECSALPIGADDSNSMSFDYPV